MTGVCDPAVRSSTLTCVRELFERQQSFAPPGADTRLTLLVSKWNLACADSLAWRRR
jgi:hypothetical protein